MSHYCYIICAIEIPKINRLQRQIERVLHLMFTHKKHFNGIFIFDHVYELFFYFKNNL